MAPSVSWLLSSLRSEPELAGALVALLEDPPSQPSDALLGALDELSHRIDIGEATQQLARTAISQLAKPSTDTGESGSHDSSSSDSSSEDSSSSDMQAGGAMALEDAQLQAGGTEANSTDGMQIEALDMEEPCGLELECLQLEFPDSTVGMHVEGLDVEEPRGLEGEEMALEEFVSGPGPASPQPDPTGGVPSWNMGKDCRGYVGRRYRPLEEQSQVLLANAVEKLQNAKPSSPTRAPAQLERQVLAACPTHTLLHELLQRCPVAAQHALSGSTPCNVVAGLCCIAPSTVRRIWQHAAIHRAPQPVHFCTRRWHHHQTTSTHVYGTVQPCVYHQLAMASP